MSEFTVRAMRPEDRDAVAEIQRQTLYFGGPLPFPVADLDALLGFWVDYYLSHELEAGAIVETAEGEIGGYSVGCLDPPALARWQRRKALELGWLWASHWSRYDAFTRLYYRLRLQDAWDALHDPPVAMDACLHWNVLPTVRGRVIWTLLRRFRDYLREQGRQTFGGDYPLRNLKKSTSSWERLGFEVVHTARHHTLTVISGEPVTRITIRADIDRLRV